MRTSDGAANWDVRRSVFARGITPLVLCVFAAFFASGCLKFGYDAEARPVDGGADAATVHSDARPPDIKDAGLDSGLVSPAADGGKIHPDMDANVDASSVDGGVDAGRDAAAGGNVTDGSTVSDADVEPGPDGSAADGGMMREVDSGPPPPCGAGAVNACGGCSTLSDLPDQNCGQCGLGRFACDGTDAVSCEGGDALPVAPGGSMLIDDLEDGDGVTLSGNGYWFAYSDTTSGTIDPPNGSRITPATQGAAGTTRSAHVSGGGFTDYGAGLILWPNTNECQYNASAQQGIGFWIKGSSTVLFSVATTRTRDPVYCGTKCNDFHGRSFTLTNTWTYYQVRWSTLAQAGWGTPATFNPSQVLYFQFSFGANVNFDLYVDEFRFY